MKKDIVSIVRCQLNIFDMEKYWLHGIIVNEISCTSVICRIDHRWFSMNELFIAESMLGKNVN